MQHSVWFTPCLPLSAQYNHICPERFCRVSLLCQLQASQPQFPNWASDVAWHRAQTKKPHFSAGPGSCYLSSGSPHTASGPRLAHICPVQQMGGAGRAESAPSQGRCVRVGLSPFHYTVTFPSQPLNDV